MSSDGFLVPLASQNQSYLKSKRHLWVNFPLNLEKRWKPKWPQGRLGKPLFFFPYKHPPPQSCDVKRRGCEGREQTVPHPPHTQGSLFLPKKFSSPLALGSSLEKLVHMLDMEPNTTAMGSALRLS